MITHFSFKNYKTFADRVDVPLTANGLIKRLSCNAVTVGGRPILKTIGIYGPNNTGKTCLILALANLKNLMLNQPHENLTNSFMDDDVIEYDVEYVIDGCNYRYKVAYDCKKNAYLEEELATISIAPSNAHVKTYTPLICRRKDGVDIPGLDVGKGSSLFSLFSSDYPIISTLKFDEESPLGKAKKHYQEFANSILLLRFDQPLDLNKTLQLMQQDPHAQRFISEFIRNCDLHITDFGLSEDVVSDVDLSGMLPQGVVPETLKFYSVHGKFRVPSVLFDSVGTQKLIALSGYLYEAIKFGKILLVDEIDSSLHHILTRAIIALFNNVLNKKAQLIFSTQDLLLMDLKRLFRKDQVFLTTVDPSTHQSIVIHLSDISSRDENGFRGDEDIVDYYLHGQFGAVPRPELFELLEEAVNEG